MMHDEAIDMAVPDAGAGSCTQATRRETASGNSESWTQPSIRRMLRSASATAILQSTSNALSFVLSVLLARMLGSRGYGLYALAFAWATFLMIPAILGLDRFLVRGIAVYEVNEEWSLMKGLLRRTNQLVLLSASTIAGCGAVAGMLWLSGSFRGPFCVAMLLIPLTTLTLLRQGAMQAIGRVVTGQFPEYLIRPLLIIVGVTALALAGPTALTPASALGMNVAGVAVAFVVGALLLRRALPPVLRSVAPEFITSEWLRASLPMMLVTGVWAANSYAAILVVGAIDGPRQAGIYTVAQKGAELIVVLLVAINMPLAPVIAKLHARNDRHGLEHTTERMARATLLVSAPIAAAFIVAPHLYLGIFGVGFRSGGSALVILALGQVINAAAGPAGNVLIMSGHERAAAQGVGAGLVANVVLAVILVPPLGITGGAIAFASSLTLWNVALVVLARRRLRVNVTAFARLSMQTLATRSMVA
jgi:O-antigen/teichoic acid export membrane protein